MLVINGVVEELLVAIVCSRKDQPIYIIDHLKWSLMLINCSLSSPWTILLMEDSIHYVWGFKKVRGGQRSLWNGSNIVVEMTKRGTYFNIFHTSNFETHHGGELGNNRWFRVNAQSTQATQSWVHWSCTLFGSNWNNWKWSLQCYQGTTILSAWHPLAHFCVHTRPSSTCNPKDDEPSSS